jgi:hypothetical protein
MSSEISTSTISFNLPATVGQRINQAAVAKVNEALPELDFKTRAFDRNNSQSTLSLMTLTMLNGQSPMRMLRQILAEVERRKMALAEAQVSHAEVTVEISELFQKSDPVSQAKLRQKQFSLDVMESKINGAFKDIATLADAYKNIETKHGIAEWDERTFEAEESRHHVRRGFELMYRNLLEGGRAQTATIEYLQQYGVHPQVALTEVSGYINFVAQQISEGQLPHASALEDFLDQMAGKYVASVAQTSERIFGVSDFTNQDYMLKLESKNDH